MYDYFKRIQTQHKPKAGEGAPLCAKSFGCATTIHQHKPVALQGFKRIQLEVGASIQQSLQGFTD
jgi:hypothetical protein